MAEALLSIVLEQLASIGRQQAEEGIRLVTGAEQEVAKLQSSFLAIQNVLVDAENRQVKENAVKVWLAKLKDVSYDIDDVLDEWNTKIQKLKLKKAEDASKPLKKVCSLILHYLSCRPLVLRYNIGSKIKDLNGKLDIIALEKDRFNFSTNRNGGEELDRQVTSSVIDLTEVHGRDEYKKRIVDLLLDQGSQGQVLPIISIVGMGGIGKTTLARLAFNDDQVNSHFDKKIWVCVSEPFDVIRIAKAILESLTNNQPNLAELETVLQNIRQHIEGKKFLLVLDDVWTENPRSWDQLKNSLKCGSLDSRILVTTRNENVANIIGTTDIISLGKLSKEECWSLFNQIAFFGKTNQECENLKEISQKIVEKCKGLPLAVKTLGSLLRFKRKIEEWQNILDSELWEIEEVEQGLFPPLLLSYYDLPPILKKCFLYCAIFPKDYEIGKYDLIRLWKAQDYLRTRENKDMELIGEKYFETLAMRSFFQDFLKDEIDNSIVGCKMHDIVHDCAQFLTQNECFPIEVDGAGELELKSSYNKVRHLLIKIKTEASFPTSIYTENSLLRSLVVECEYNEPKMVCSKLFDQLTCLRSLVLRWCSTEEVPIEIGKLIHLRYLELFNNHEIKELPEALCGLYNLETLDIDSCSGLQKLPQGMEKLINLRNLRICDTSISYMPKSVERLTRLQTLGEFVISDGSYGSKACSIECLKNFKDLRSLGIKGLGYLTDVDKVKEVELNNKKNLHYQLSLSFEGMMNEEHEVLLEALRPPSNLERLFIENYRGNTVFPNWMMSLTNLKMLWLESCTNCEHLPPLGKLSSLEFLGIKDVKSVRRVGNEFLGVESDVISSSLSDIAFPKLKHLRFYDMNEWEEWNYKITKKGEEDIKVMPHLQGLYIGNCPKLTSLPNHLRQMTTLQKNINGCPLEQELGRTHNSSSSSPVLDHTLSNP